MSRPLKGLSWSLSPTRQTDRHDEDALLDLTDRSEIVIDPFLGSGPTLIAAEATGRLGRGVELNPPMST